LELGLSLVAAALTAEFCRDRVDGGAASQAELPACVAARAAFLASSSLRRSSSISFCEVNDDVERTLERDMAMGRSLEAVDTQAELLRSRAAGGAPGKRTTVGWTLPSRSTRPGRSLCSVSSVS